jgi:hypothetical protein
MMKSRTAGRWAPDERSKRSARLGGAADNANQPGAADRRATRQRSSDKSVALRLGVSRRIVVYRAVVYAPFAC